jgi:catechol 2,3-dioxygenase-like lactoylglutathione lyase family enzyme
VIALVMLLLRYHRGLDGHDHVEGARSGIHPGFTAVSFAGSGAPGRQAGQDRAMMPMAANHLRIARPSHDLRAAERFWVEGLGLDVLFRADESAEGGHALLMVGWPDAAWHLELVGDPGDATPAAPTDEDLLVLYVGGEIDDDVVGRLVEAGGSRVAARNPYWDRWGVTIADPDGYRLVLSTRSWP